MEGQQHGEQLKRGLKNRHIQLIALGGAIGTGLFLGSASVIQSAGPGIILGYAIAGLAAVPLLELAHLIRVGNPRLTLLKICLGVLFKNLSDG